MRRMLLAVSFWLLAIGFVNAQEAFYIYRNDGDFNGFFYDEVQELRYSKLALDSTEFEQYVTYEVVLADTTYRIPLAAIDSIGFQQPEIKFNPKVRFVGREGLSQYIYRVVDGEADEKVYFLDLPSNLIPQVGDILLGLASDPNAEEIYWYASGSFSCVVETITDLGYGYLEVSGRPVQQLNEVFDQFVTVEQIGVDKQGNIRRRIAGCTPDGFPRKAPAASGESAMDLIDLSSTFVRSWGNPEANYSVDLSADVNLNVKLRAAYNISWTRLVTSLSQEYVTKVKPSLGLSYSRSFEFEADDLLPIPIGEIVFPAACPIFAINPVPTLFLRGEGKAEARLKMPAVQLGVGLRFSFDTGADFPVLCALHLVENEGDKLSEDMLDLSAELSLSGYVQTGIKFSGDISTASWMRKVLRSSIGVYLYVGPKIGGSLSLAKADLNGGGLSLYNSLSSSYLNVALPSLDLEAKAIVSVFSKDETEKTFFNKNWAFFADTVFMAPAFDKPIVNFDDDTMHIKFPSQRHACLGYQRVAAGVMRRDPKDPSSSSIVYQSAESPYDRKRKAYEYTIPLASLRAAEYTVCPQVKTWSFAPMEGSPSENVIVPPTVKMSSDSLVFGATTNLQQSIEVTSNVVGESNIWVKEYLNGEKQVIDESAGKYQFTFTLPPNDRLFDYRISKESQMYYISARSETEREAVVKDFPFAICQQANNLQGFTFELEVFSNTCDALRFKYENYYPITATRVGDNKIHVTGQYTDYDYTYRVDVNLIRDPDYEGYSVDSYSVSGTVSKTYSSSFVGMDENREHEVTYTTTTTWSATITPAGDYSAETVKATYDHKVRAGGSTVESSHCEDNNAGLSKSAQVHLP